MSLTKRWLESQQEIEETAKEKAKEKTEKARDKAIDDIFRDVRHALRIIGSDRPLDWEDRTQAEQALDSALTSLELLKQEIKEIKEINDISKDNCLADFLYA